MLNWLKNKRNNKKGFSLVELIIVVAILAILVGVLAPQYLKYVEKSRKSTDVSNLDSLVGAVKVAAADTDYNISAGKYTITMTRTNTTVEYTPNTGNTETVKDTKILAALKEFAGYTFTDAGVSTDLKLKSNRWNTVTGNTTNTIKAEIVIDDDSSVTVTYTPSAVLDLTNEKETTTPTTAAPAAP